MNMFRRLFGLSPEPREIIISNKGTPWHCCYRSDHGGNGYNQGSYVNCPIDGSPTLAGHSFNISDGSAQLVENRLEFSFIVPIDVGPYVAFNFWLNVNSRPIRVVLERMFPDHSDKLQVFDTGESDRVLLGGNQEFNVEVPVSALGLASPASVLFRTTLTGDAKFRGVDFWFGWWPTQGSRSKI